MTQGGDELFVTVGGRDIGLEQLLKKVDAEMQNSANNAVRLGQSYARLAQAQGQPAAASEILAGTMQRAGAASERTLIGLATQQANLGNSSRNLTSTIAGLGGQLSGLGGTAGQLAGSIGNLAGSFGTLGGIGAAIGIGKVAVDLSVAGANADLVRQRFDGLAEAANTTGDAMLRALQAASGGEISNLNLELAANRAQILGVADSAEEMSVLLEIARDRAQQLGTSSAKAFDDLVTGLGRGSPLILDNLGIIVSVKEANDQYAASLGKTASALTEAEQKQALINAVLAQGRASLAATGGAVESNASIFQRFGASMENAKNAAGSFLSQGIAPIAAQATQTADAITGVANAANAFLDSLRQIGTGQADSAAQATANAAATAAYSAEIERSGNIVQANAAYEAAHAASLAQTAAGAQAATDIEQQRLNVLNATAAITQQAQTASLVYADSLAMTGVQARAAALASEQKANADQLAGVNAQIHAVEQQKLADAARQAASFLLANGDAGARTAALLAGSSQQVDVLTAAYYRLAAAQQVAKAADPLKGVTEDRLTRDTQADRAKVKSDQALEANRKLLASINALNKPPKGGGGGGPKLSDQQKLQNSLLASQEDYQQKSEDAATQHAIDVEKIYQDFFDKMRDAERDFDQARLEGSASFYDQQGQIESAAIRQSASDQYEAAALEAGKIAQEKGADVAEKYMAAQEKIIQARSRRLVEIEKAEQDKDAGKAEYLRGVDAKYKAAEDAQLARVKEGEGSLAAERDKQLQDATAKEIDAQDKIKLSADRAAESKILASDRAGKKIDEEALKVAGLASQYDRLGLAGSRAGITPAAGAGAGATTPAAGTPATPVPAGAGATPGAAPDLTAIFESMRKQLAAIESAINSSGDKVAGAVRNAGPRIAS